MQQELPQIDRIIKGMEIIRRYDLSDPLVSVAHDVIYCGSAHTIYHMTDNDRAQLATYGWTDAWRPDPPRWAFYL